MSLRRLVTAASTIAVAIALAVIVPVAQLRTVASETECCCPDPALCKCPDHQPDRSTQPTMKACSETPQGFVAPVLPSFVPPAIELALAPMIEGPRPVPVQATPHAPPPPQRPDAPS